MAYTSQRIEDYLKIDQEPCPVPSKQPPAAWPTSGEIILDKLSARYFPDGPTVLDQISLHIGSGERVGIVGRTGSGKSTLALAILRMIPTSGCVIIDGRKTENTNLDALRANVTIIPQDPMLLSGSLRFNLDPWDEHDDVTLNDALMACGLGPVRYPKSRNRIESGVVTSQELTLDFEVATEGANLSQGQKQLVALARALVRSSKILILDEVGISYGEQAVADTSRRRHRLTLTPTRSSNNQFVRYPRPPPCLPSPTACRQCKIMTRF